MTTAIDLKKIVICFIVTIACGFAFTSTAFAQSPSAGVRMGISGDPDQFYFGAHVTVAEVIKELWFRPNIEIGVGDDVTFVTLNGEFIYHFNINSREWKPYVGAGPAVVVATNGGTDVGPGFNFLLGIEKQKGLLTEIKVGVIDSPEFKFGVGWNF